MKKFPVSNIQNKLDMMGVVDVYWLTGNLVYLSLVGYGVHKWSVGVKPLIFRFFIKKIICCTDGL